MRKRLAGLFLDERAAHAFGEGLYTEAMGQQTYTEALRLAADMLAAGWPVVVDGSFSHVRERDEARALARRLGVPHVVLWCRAPREVIAERLRRRARDRHEVSDGRLELLAPHRARYETPAAEPGVIRLDTTGDSDRAVEAGPARARAIPDNGQSLRVPRHGPPQRRRGEDARLVRCRRSRNSAWSAPGRRGRSKRLRHSPRVRVAPCNAHGRVQGAWRDGIGPHRHRPPGDRSARMRRCGRSTGGRCGSSTASRGSPGAFAAAPGSRSRCRRPARHDEFRRRKR